MYTKQQFWITFSEYEGNSKLRIIMGPFADIFLMENRGKKQMLVEVLVQATVTCISLIVSPLLTAKLIQQH